MTAGAEDQPMRHESTVSYYDPDWHGENHGEWVPAAPLPLYPDPVPSWWKRTLARLLWPVFGRGVEKPTWMN